MKILITGVGSTGKSTLRRLLVKACRSIGIRTEHYDADDFQKPRCSEDADSRRPESFRDDVLYIIEDVRGPVPGKAFLPISDYDGIIYVMPGPISNLMFWLPRAWRWYQKGKFDWDRNTGWRGIQKSYDVRNIAPIMKRLARYMRRRKEWIKEDLVAISGKPHLIIKSVWSPKGIRWKI